MCKVTEVETMRWAGRRVWWALAILKLGTAQFGPRVWSLGLSWGSRSLVLGRYPQMDTFQSFPCLPQVLLVVQHPTTTAIKPERFQLDSQGSLWSDTNYQFLPPFSLYEPIVLKNLLSWTWLQRPIMMSPVLSFSDLFPSIHSSLERLQPFKPLCYSSHVSNTLMPQDLCTCCPVCLECLSPKWAHPRFTPLFQSSLCSKITPPKTLPSFIFLVWHSSLPEIIELFILFPTFIHLPH